jgi:hypothetical protein
MRPHFVQSVAGFAAGAGIAAAATVGVMGVADGAAARFFTLFFFAAFCCHFAIFAALTASHAAVPAPTISDNAVAAVATFDSGVAGAGSGATAATSE